MTGHTEENKNMKYGVHKFPLCQSINNCADYIKNSSANQPVYYSHAVGSLCRFYQGLEGDEHHQAHKYVRQCFNMTVSLQFSETNYDTNDGDDPYQ